MKNKDKYRSRSLEAHALISPKFKYKIILSKKAYKRKPKHVKVVTSWRSE